MATDARPALRADAPAAPAVAALPRTIEVAVSPRAVRRVLLVAVAVLTTLSVAAQVARFAFDIQHAKGLVPLVDAIREHNVPTFYSSVTLLVAALLAGALALSVRGRQTRGWAALAAIFFLAGMDEFITFHELVDEWMKSFVSTGGVLYWAWVIPGAAFALAVLVALRSFVKGLPQPVRRRLVVGTALFLGGALGVEMAEGTLLEASEGQLTLAWGIVCTAQETLEMLGVLFWLEALVIALVPCRLLLKPAR